VEVRFASDGSYKADKAKSTEKIDGAVATIMALDRAEASNAIEGIVTTSTRIKQLVEEKTTPKNRDEQEIAGYRNVLNIIHESFDAIPISQNYILQLHKILYSHMNNPMAGRTKSVQNYISATYPDGNGRMSRLLTTLLLYRNGFYVGKYISLEAKIAKNKDLYYNALGQAQIGWHEGALRKLVSSGELKREGPGKNICYYRLK
jgi:Fic family protein